MAMKLATEILTIMIIIPLVGFGTSSAWVTQQGKNDENLALDVTNKILNYVHYTIYDLVWVKVKNGNVTLEGYVTTPYKSEEMTKMVKKIQGVENAENKIEALPVSKQDQHLRQTIARRIYSEDLFFGHSIGTNAPIHVVVKNSRVILAGTVQSDIEKVMAEQIARSTFGVLDVDNQIEVR
jgi:osmotically-inducible protein OsmY